MKLYQAIVRTFNAYLSCIEKDNKEWKLRHKETIENLCRDHLPRGSGFDNGTKFNFDESKPNKLVFDVSFHHMDENGYYDGWSYHQVIVTPDLSSGCDLEVTGEDTTKGESKVVNPSIDRDDINNYIGDVFYSDLYDEIDE